MKREGRGRELFLSIRRKLPSHSLIKLKALFQAVILLHGDLDHNQKAGDESV